MVYQAVPRPRQKSECPYCLFGDLDRAFFTWRIALKVIVRVSDSRRVLILLNRTGAIPLMSLFIFFCENFDEP